MSRITGLEIAPERSGRVEFDPLVLLAFLYPLTQLVVFRFVGQLYLADVAGIVLLLALLFARGAFAMLGQLRLLFALLALWLAAQVLTDLVRDTPPQDFLRGWAKIAFFGVQLAALWLFLPRRRAYMIAFATGSVFAWSLGIQDQFAGYEWKFGYDRAAAFGLIAFLWLATRKMPRATWLTPPLFAALAAYVMFQNARASFVVLLLTAGVCFLSLLARRWPRFQARLRPLGFAAILAVGIAAASGVSAVYGNAAQSGALGADAQWKYDLQTQGDIPLLLGGRSESIISLRAIGDSPIVGHGSWAKDRRYVELYRSLRLRMGMRVHDNFFNTRELIPTHSYLFGAWVEAGVMGALFWLYVLTLPFIAIYHLLKRDEPLLPLVAYLAIGLMWAIPFSPFGATERFIAAFQIVAVAWTIRAGGHSLLPWRDAAAPATALRR